MSKGLFTDKTLMPTENIIREVIGKSAKNWDILFNYLSEDLKLKAEFRFYGVNYGWAMRFIKSGKSIIAIYPNKNCFTVQIILNKNQVDSALSENLDLRIVQTIKDTEPIHEGKWIYLVINESTEMKDILKIVQIRIKIK